MNYTFKPKKSDSQPSGFFAPLKNINSSQAICSDSQRQIRSSKSPSQAPKIQFISKNSSSVAYLSSRSHSKDLTSASEQRKGSKEIVRTKSFTSQTHRSNNADASLSKVDIDKRSVSKGILKTNDQEKNSPKKLIFKQKSIESNRLVISQALSSGTGRQSLQSQITNFQSSVKKISVQPKHHARGVASTKSYTQHQEFIDESILKLSRDAQQQQQQQKVPSLVRNIDVKSYANMKKQSSSIDSKNHKDESQGRRDQSENAKISTGLLLSSQDNNIKREKSAVIINKGGKSIDTDRFFSPKSNLKTLIQQTINSKPHNILTSKSANPKKDYNLPRQISSPAKFDKPTTIVTSNKNAEGNAKTDLIQIKANVNGPDSASNQPPLNKLSNSSDTQNRFISPNKSADDNNDMPFQIVKPFSYSKPSDFESLKGNNVKETKSNPVFVKINNTNKPVTFQETNTSPFVIKRKADEQSKVNSGCNITNMSVGSIGMTQPPKSLLISTSSNKLNQSKLVPKKMSKTVISSFDLMRGGYQGPGLKKNNQDNYFHYKNFNGIQTHMYLGVCDGHGLNGHDASFFLRNNLPMMMELEIRSNNLSIEKEMLIKSKSRLVTVIKEVFQNCNLALNSKVDTIFSGSTCSSLFLTPEQIITINCGDSRAVLGKFKNNSWSHLDLTRDHKPDEPDEKLRIVQSGGRVEPLKDEKGVFIGPSRVWIKEKDLPGLAMSRSFGDQLAASVGTTCEPEIFEYNFESEDKFLIVASDGVWEFISSSDSIRIIKDYYLINDPKSCCEFLLKEASTRWIQEEQVIDDISMILLFFD